MISKKQLNNWITEIDKLRKNLHTGGGAMISSSYSKENEELFKAATACRNLLTMYYSYEGLSPDQLKRLMTLMQDMKLKAVRYEEAKENGKPGYSITGNPRRGIIAARGDKLTRLKAADGLIVLTNLVISPALSEGIKNKDAVPVKLSSEFRKTENSLGSPEADAEKITNNLNNFVKQSSPKMEIMEFHRHAVNAWRTYQEEIQNSFWGKKTNLKQLRKEFKEINNLHRLELLEYSDSKEFLKSFKENRFKIHQVVEIYNWARKCKEGTPEQQENYNKFRVALGLTHEGFENLAEKVSALEMIGRHMDARMSMCASSEFTKLSTDAIQDIARMSKEDLGVRIKTAIENQNNPQLPNEYKPSDARIKYLKNVYKFKNLEEIGVGKLEQPGISKEKSYTDRTVGDSFKRRFKFLNVQAKIGRKQNKRNYVTGVVDLPVLLKAKLGKVSLKYQTKNKLFKAGAHAGVLGSNVAGSVGIGFSLKNPLSSKVQAMGLAEAYAARGVAKANLGTDNLNVEAKASGHIGHAKIEGNVGLGHIYKTDSKGKVTADGLGLELKGGASAAVFSGRVEGGLSIFGVRISVAAEGKAVAAGLEGEFSFIPNKGVRLGGGGALGIGGGFYISIDWGSLTEKYRRWKERRTISKAALKAKKEEERKLKEQRKAEEKRRKEEERKRKLEEAKRQKAIKEEQKNTKHVNHSNEIKGQVSVIKSRK